METDIPLLDMNTVNSLKDIFSDEYINMITDFDTITHRLLDELISEEDSSDPLSTLGRLHSLKGSSANIGASLLSFKFRQLEDALKQSPNIDTKPALNKLKKLLDQTTTAFKAQI